MVHKILDATGLHLDFRAASTDDLCLHRPLRREQLLVSLGLELCNRFREDRVNDPGRTFEGLASGVVELHAKIFEAVSVGLFPLTSAFFVRLDRGQHIFR